MKYPRIIEEGNYINGKKEGTWTYWNRKGSFNVDVYVKAYTKSDGTKVQGYYKSDPEGRKILKEEIYEDGVLIEK